MSYRCPRTWDELSRTTNRNERFCGECKKIVHFCTTQEQLDQAIARGWCVAAVFVEPKPALMIGEPAPPPYTQTVRGKRKPTGERSD